MRPLPSTPAARWLALLLALAAGPRLAAGADVKTRAPDPAAGGEVYEWKSGGGITCWWRAPKSYDAERGTNLTVILHGSNLTHEWGFANHDRRTFRPDDFVLSPDGTTPNGQGGFNFLKDDARKLHALLEEVRKAVRVRALFLYGHSQGSFFALHYAGEYPDEVGGVVAHASGLWTWTQTGKRGHAQAIVLMHGTQDPVVPYGQSVGGFEALREAGYPVVRLRSLEGWNHWPAEHNGPVAHTSQQLAWVEGMTTTDPERLEASFGVLVGASADAAAEHDWAGLASLAGRIAGLDAAPADLRRRAERAREEVEALARAHVAAIALPEEPALDGSAWSGHLPVFLRAFPGVPAREALASQCSELLERHRKDGTAALRKYYAALGKGKAAEAFEAGATAVASGYLWHECWNGELRKNLRAWRKDARTHKLSKAALKTYDAVFEDFEKGMESGWKAFEAVQRKGRPGR